MSKDNIEFACPAEMKFWSEKVFAGEYAIEYVPKHPLVILDIGANCGAFALWANELWPGSLIHCYEPAQINYFYLATNTKPFPNITTERTAVLSTEKRKLFVGRTNQGEASFCEDLKQTDDTYEVPPVIHPGSLPKSDIVKIDTEGCELEIILGLNNAGLLPEFILLEYHREFDRRSIDIELRDYILVGSRADYPERGVVKYRKRAK